jgi:hypothetical protein
MGYIINVVDCTENSNYNCIIGIAPSSHNLVYLTDESETRQSVYCTPLLTGILSHSLPSHLTRIKLLKKNIFHIKTISLLGTL